MIYKSKLRIDHKIKMNILMEFYNITKIIIFIYKNTMYKKKIIYRKNIKIFNILIK
jgi:hypothetical protein